MKSLRKLFAHKLQILTGMQECPSVCHTRHEQRSEAANICDSPPPHSRIQDEARDDTRARTGHSSLTPQQFHNIYVTRKYPALAAGTVISPFAYNCISHDHTVRTTNQLTLHPLHGTVRIHKEKDVSAMMHNKEAATETGQPSRLPISLPYPRSAIRGCEVLFTIHESVLNPFKAVVTAFTTCSYIQLPRILSE